MSRRKPRGLRADEMELWRRVAENTAPLHRDPDQRLPKEPAHAPMPPKQGPRVDLKKFRIGSHANIGQPRHDLAQPIAQSIASAPIEMDKKRFSQLKKGRISPQARIDLHGMTLVEAHPALIRFVLDAVADGKRLVLVITGKGKCRPEPGPIPQRLGVLRHQVPHWLNAPILKPHVLQVSEAHVRHGGQGAYYVYLRRRR